jgi:hypothetical protein
VARDANQGNGMKRIFAVLALVGAMACVMPSVASADTFAGPREYRVSQNPGYRGWGTVEPNTCQRYGCMMAFQTHASAYRWNGSSWNQTTRRTGTQVYIWPYGSGWSWTWTQSTGWLAMQQEVLTYRA